MLLHIQKYPQTDGRIHKYKLLRLYELRYWSTQNNLTHCCWQSSHLQWMICIAIIFVFEIFSHSFDFNQIFYQSCHASNMPFIQCPIIPFNLYTNTLYTNNLHAYPYLYFNLYLVIFRKCYLVHNFQQVKELKKETKRKNTKTNRIVGEFLGEHCTRIIKYFSIRKSWLFYTNVLCDCKIKFSFHIFYTVI